MAKALFAICVILPAFLPIAFNKRYRRLKGDTSFILGYMVAILVVAKLSELFRDWI